MTNLVVAARYGVWGAGMLLAASMSCPQVAVSRADPTRPAEPDVVSYATTAAPAVCRSLDIRPTLRGVLLAMQDVMDQSGFGSRQASHVVTLSVTDQCPRHTHLLEEMVALVENKGEELM